MYFESLTDALSMSGHGPYVWSAYAITLVIVVGLMLSPWRRARTLRQRILAEQRRQAAANMGGDHAS